MGDMAKRGQPSGITLVTVDERGTNEALYRLVGNTAKVTMQDGTMIEGMILGTQWRQEAARGLHFSPARQPGTLILPYATLRRVALD